MKLFLISLFYFLCITSIIHLKADDVDLSFYPSESNAPTNQHQIQHQGQQTDKIAVMIGFESREVEDNFLIMSEVMYDKDESDLVSVSSVRKKKFRKFQYTNAIAIEVTKEEWDQLEQDPDVLYIEHDHLVYALEEPALRGSHFVKNSKGFNNTSTLPRRRLSETASYGLFAVQGDIELPIADTKEDCLINVCIVDSGLHINHFDIPYSLDEPQFIKGEEFGLPLDQVWYNSKGIDHGTAVAGIMVAKGGNNEGIVSVIPNGPEESKICLLIARVFPDYEGTTSTSDVIAGVEWCASEDAHVVNLSLGGPGGYSNAQKNAYQTIYESGVLLLGAAGNNGDDALSFPASLDAVISIAAVNEENKRASFSQYNDKVELTGPGAYILTTKDGGDSMSVQVEKEEYIAVFLQENNFRSFDFSLSREIFDCGFGFDPCDLDASNKSDEKICLIQRGSILFSEKAKNCEAGGGSMALIYNNDNSDLIWTLGIENDVSIPVLALSLDDGTSIKNVLPASATTSEVSSTLGCKFFVPHCISF